MTEPIAFENPERVVAWFSCGVASAVAAKLAIDKYGEAVDVVYCDTSSDEHPDNARFTAQVEQWLGVKIKTLKNPKFSNVDTVFLKQRYVSGPKGAPCTVQLKKVPRFVYQNADDVHVFGYTVDELPRVKRFEADNPELYLWWPLVEAGLRKEDCFVYLKDAGIELPMMYRLGFKNNNCLGCVKSSSVTYWEKIRELFPRAFESRDFVSYELGCRLLKVTKKGVTKRFFLRELDLAKEYMKKGFETDQNEDLSCGPQCKFTP